MNKDSRLVVKDNALINASFNLLLVEQRLMLLAIVEARELPILTPDTAIEIRATAYREQYNTDNSESYKQLAEASKQLFTRQFTYIDDYKGTDAVTVSRWVNEITYVDDKGMVVLYFNRNVISMISRLEANFTKYLLNQISNFKSKYSIRLYELIIQYKGLGNSKKYQIDELRKLLGVGIDEYALIADFKKRVLDKAVQEINDKSDINVSYEQFKEGRTVSHVIFKMKLKDEVHQEKKLKPLTAKQIDMYADKLSKLQSFQSHFVADMGQSADDYSKSIASKLQDGFYQNEWLSFLIEAGFKPRYAK